MNRYHSWLHKELNVWVSERLISADQAAGLRGRYPVEAGSWMLSILSGFGAVLLGLGVILLFAYNWADMPRLMKLAVVLAALIAAHTSAMALHGSQRYPRMEEGLHALGTMLFGAGIWLIAQMYHIDDHYPNAIIAWGGGALLLAWALPSLVQAIMAVALITAWQWIETFDFDRSLHLGPPLVLILLLPLVLRLHSAFLAGLVSAALLISLALCVFSMDSQLGFLSLMLVGGALVALRWTLPGLPWLRNAAAIGSAIGLPGLLAYLTILYLLGFPSLVGELIHLEVEGEEQWTYLALMSLVALVSWGWALVVTFASPSPLEQRLEVALLLGGTLLALLLGFGSAGEYGWGVVVLFNLLFLAHALLLIAVGSRQARLGLVVMGCLLLAALAGARYLDLFDSLVARALVFFLVGGALFAAANVYSHRRRQQQAKP